jgi:hypothetical protein
VAFGLLLLAAEKREKSFVWPGRRARKHKVDGERGLLKSKYSKHSVESLVWYRLWKAGGQRTLLVPTLEANCASKST